MAWIAAVLLHLGAFVGALILRVEFRRAPTRYVQLAPEPETPPYAGVRPGRGAVTPRAPGRPRGGPAAAVQLPETLPAVAHEPLVVPGRARPGYIAPPNPGDGRLWVSPRAALPSDVAEAIYGERSPRDSALVKRLRALVDSLNIQLDSVQRAGRPPSWVARGEDGKPTWGLDPSGLYVAGIKIPGPALALLGSLLPAGNYDEAVRQRHLADMRADIMQSAARAENLEQFRRYVRELRARKQAERDAQRRQRGDTATAVQ